MEGGFGGFAGEKRWLERLSNRHILYWIGEKLTDTI